MDLYLLRESILVLVRMSVRGKPEMQDRHPLEPFGSRTMLHIGTGGRYIPPKYKNSAYTFNIFLFITQGINLFYHEGHEGKSIKHGLNLSSTIAFEINNLPYILSNQFMTINTLLLGSGIFSPAFSLRD